MSRCQHPRRPPTLVLASIIAMLGAAACDRTEPDIDKLARRAREVLVDSMAAEGARILAAREAQIEAEIREVLPEVKGALRDAGHDVARARFVASGRAEVSSAWCGIVYVPGQGADSVQLRWTYDRTRVLFARTRDVLSDSSALSQDDRRTFARCGANGWSPPRPRYTSHTNDTNGPGPRSAAGSR